MSAPTKVVFRLIGGEVLALFPEVPGSRDPQTCQSYMHDGQHDVASPNAGRPCTDPATYEPLRRELESIGYVTDVRPQITPAMHKARYAAL